jgi:hypothetical protein
MLTLPTNRRQIAQRIVKSPTTRQHRQHAEASQRQAGNSGYKDGACLPAINTHPSVATNTTAATANR